MSTRTSDSDAPKRSGRAGKPKVRTGCITCKVRRIKCDEGKPFCARCTGSGRQCDGYATQRRAESAHEARLKESQFPPVNIVIKFTYASSIPPRLLEYPNSTPEELRSLEFFRCKTADKLSRWMAESFWRYQLLQTGYYEPSIRHSMIAMASIHEEMEMCEARGTDPRYYGTCDARHRYAFQHAQMAMSELSKLLAARPEATDVALINCILFVMLDFMVGNFATAILHLHNGKEILMKWHKDRPNGENFCPGSLEDNLDQLLFQLSFRSSCKEEMDPVLQHELDDMRVPPFVDLDSARRAIEFLTRNGLRIVRIGTVMSLTKQGFPARSTVDAEVETQRARLEHWSMKFETLVAEMEGCTSDGEDETIEELRSMHMSAMVWLELGVSFDHSHAAERIDSVVNMAENLHNRKCSHKHEYLSATFAFEEGVSPPISFIATKRNGSDSRPRSVALLVMMAPRVEEDDYGSIPPLGGNSVRMAQETRDRHGRRVLEVELQPMARQVDLTFVPGLENGLWEIRTDGSRSNEFQVDFRNRTESL